MDIDTVIRQIEAEYLKTDKECPGFHSAHEGYALLREEVDELWDAIKAKPRVDAHIRLEATQVAAMAIRFLVDCC